MEIEVGKVIDLENGKSYLIANHFLHDGQEYLSLVAVDESGDMIYAELNDDKDSQYITPVEDEKLIELFKQYVLAEFFADLEDDEDEE